LGIKAEWTLNLWQYETRPASGTPSHLSYTSAVKSLELAHRGVTLDTVEAVDAFGNKVTRYGYYPRLAKPVDQTQETRKRAIPPDEVVDSNDPRLVAGETQPQQCDDGREEEHEEPPSQTPRTRKMSRSDLVCFDETSSEVYAETVIESTDEDELYD
jgi:hypothetical protein